MATRCCWPPESWSGRAAKLFGQADARQEAGAGPSDSSRESLEDKQRPGQHIFQHAHVREQVELLKHHAHAAAELAERFRHFAARRAGTEPHFVDLHFAFLKRLQTVDAAQQRALAAARGTDHGGHFAAAHGERHAVEHAERSVVFHEVADFDHAFLKIDAHTSYC